MINDRLFGSDIPTGVKQKLRDRQNLLSEAVPFEDLSVKNNFDGEADLSSRTPFARMWTAVQLIRAPKVDESASTEDQIEERKKAQENESNINRKIYIVGTNNLSSVSQVYNNAAENKQFIIDAGGGKSQWSQEKLDQFDEKERQENLQYGLFPPEHGIDGDNNKFLKPQAGIVSVSTETGGAVGEVKSTTVNFVVHNFHDYDQIYNKFFLKPGAQIYVDYGWDTLTQPLYNPYELLTKSYNDAEKFLYGEKYKVQDEVAENGWVTNNAGDCNTAVGSVKDYTAKILPNGSVECSVTIQGKNNLTEKKVTVSESYAEENYTKFVKKLDEQILFEQIYSLGDEGARGKLDLAIKNLSTGASNYEKFKKLIQATANDSFGGTKFTPTTAAALSGLYIKGSDTYINWGLFEDTFLNNYFAAGKNLETINNNTGTEGILKFDSSNSFAVFKNGLYLRQGDELKSPPFLIPEQWDYTYNTRIDKSGLSRAARIEEMEDELTEEDRKKTENAFRQYFSKEFNDYNEIQTIEDSTGDVSVERLNYISRRHPELMKITNYDWSQYRIPLREVFVNTSVIKKAFEDNSKNKLKDALNQILGTINGVFDNKVWDWKVTANGNTNMSVQDLNYSPETRENYEKKVAQAQQEVAEQYETGKFSDIFTFNIMGPNSMVTTYDVSTNFPQGDLGNMVAVSSIIANDKKFYPPSALIHRASSMATLLNTYTDEKAAGTDVMFQYLPARGEHEVQVIANEPTENVNIATYYKDATEVLKKLNPVKSLSYGGIDNYLTEQQKEQNEALSQNTKPPEPTNNGKSNTKTTKDPVANTINQGKNLHKNSDSYWQSIIKAEEYIDEQKINPMPLPINLTLTVYGIGTMQVGDIFKVDYLPQIYLERVYFQTMKVMQNLDTTGWYTTLETQYRVLPESVVNNISTATPSSTKGFENRKGITQDLRKSTSDLDGFTFTEVLESENYKSTTENFLDPEAIGDDTFGGATWDNIDQYYYRKSGKDQIGGTVFQVDPLKQTYVNEERFNTQKSSDGIYQFTTKNRKDNSYDEGYPDQKLASSRKDEFVKGIKDKNKNTCSILVNKNLRTLTHHCMKNLRTITHPTLEMNIRVWLFELDALGQTFTEENDPTDWAGDVWINNPVYRYDTQGKNTAQGRTKSSDIKDGWGLAGVTNPDSTIGYYSTGRKMLEREYTNTAGQLKTKNVLVAGRSLDREDLYIKWITNGYYAHKEMCYLIVSNKDPKCWAVIPKKGNSLDSIVKTYDLEEVGGGGLYFDQYLKKH